MSTDFEIVTPPGSPPKSSPGAPSEAPARLGAGRRIERRFHRSVYLGLQTLRGRPVGVLMRRLRDWDALDADGYRQLVERRLKDALIYARRRTPCYRTGPWDGALRGVDSGRIEPWPVLERNALIEHRDALVAEGRRILVRRNSSASTGTPVTVFWNPAALAWSWAAEYHPMRWHGLELGSRTLRIWGSGRAFENWALNRHFVPAHELNPARLDAAVRYLETARPELVWGSPSAVTELARHVAQQRGPGAEPLVRHAKVGGEQVYPFQREEIRRYLGARVIEAYGCTEVGPIAAECPRGALHILGSNVHVEIFRNGEPVRVGELGDIVATTLINRGMPLVRCRIGDTGRLAPEPCPCGLPQPVLADLRGRAHDLLFKPDGTAVHGSVLVTALQGYVGLAPLGHAQNILFEQLDQRTWRVQVESPQCQDAQGLERQVTELVRDTFGDGCRAATELVEKIPREASGKYRYYRTLKQLRVVQTSRAQRTPGFSEDVGIADLLTHEHAKGNEEGGGPGLRRH